MGIGTRTVCGCAGLMAGIPAPSIQRQVHRYGWESRRHGGHRLHSVPAGGVHEREDVGRNPCRLQQAKSREVHDLRGSPSGSLLACFWHRCWHPHRSPSCALWLSRTFGHGTSLSSFRNAEQLPSGLCRAVDAGWKRPPDRARRLACCINRSTRPQRVHDKSIVPYARFTFQHQLSGY